jgi:hypothetical protein
MESFFLSETAKYLYLLWSDAAALPDFYLLSTEGHLMPPIHPSRDSTLDGSSPLSGCHCSPAIQARGNTCGNMDLALHATRVLVRVLSSEERVHKKLACSRHLYDIMYVQAGAPCFQQGSARR